MEAPKVLDNLKPVHIASKLEDIKDIVIMPGDPLRAKYIAETFLTDARLVNDTRNMLAYTGFYKDREVTVMGSGMGMPSMSIYCFELFYFYGVKKIIRVGTCGGIAKGLKVPDLILAEASYNEGSFAYLYNGDPTHLAYANKELNQTILAEANNLNLHLTKGTVMSTENFSFYSDIASLEKRIPKNIKVIAEEMESFALFHIADSLKREAACILTVVDSKDSNVFMSQDDREKSLNDSIVLALESIIK